ncbi:MAG TPA: hypothetical protein VFZ23_02840 [Pyrinomonadaceae bacterium]
MRSVLTRVVVPALIGLVGTVPFIILEGVNTRGFATKGFPVALFGALWLLGFAFAGSASHVFRSFKKRSYAGARPLVFLLSTAFLVLIAVSWASIVTDQMPCFLGIPNCD